MKLKRWIEGHGLYLTFERLGWGSGYLWGKGGAMCLGWCLNSKEHRENYIDEGQRHTFVLSLAQSVCGKHPCVFVLVTCSSCHLASGVRRDGKIKTQI